MKFYNNLNKLKLVHIIKNTDLQNNSFLQKCNLSYDFMKFLGLLNDFQKQLEGYLAIVAALLKPSGRQSQLVKWSEHGSNIAPNHSTNSKI